MDQKRSLTRLSPTKNEKTSQTFKSETWNVISINIFTAKYNLG